MSSRQVGFIQIILSGACFGLLGYFGKWAFNEGLTPGELLSSRFLVSALMLGLGLAIFKPRSLKLNRKTIITCLLLGSFGYAVFSSFYFFALKGISASLTVLLLYTYPVIVTIGSKLFYKENIGKLGWLALFLSCVGLCGLVWGELQVTENISLIFGILSAVFYAAYILVSRKVLKNVEAMPSSFFTQLGAGIAVYIFQFSSFERTGFILSNYYSMIITMAFVCSLLAMTLFLAGLQKVTPSEASIVSTTEPIFGIIFAVILLHENISLLQILGGTLVLLSMVLTAMRNPKIKT